MNAKTTKAKYLKFTILIISLCFLLGAVCACLPFNISLPQLEESAIDDTAVTITTNANDKFGEFEDGYSYIYTDKNKFEDYRTGNIDYDLTAHKVAKTSANRGTQDNPYVIATTADWETLVRFCGVDLTKSTGKYFVLANDLDFNGIDFHPVGKFGGTFYGLGHKLLNIDYSNWQYWDGSSYVTIGTSGATNSGFGVFCSATNATITDFINQDFSFSNIPQTTTASVQGTTYYGSDTGGIVGVCFGDNTFLNCHTTGVVTTSVTYSLYVAIGGIVGSHNVSGTNKSIYFYRCSSNFSMSGTINNNRGFMVGSMLGQSFCAVNILDCAGEVYANPGNAGVSYIGSIFGWPESTETLRFENIVGKVNIDTTVTEVWGGALVGTRGTSNVKVANAYGEGYIGSPNAKTSMYAILHYSTVPAASAFTNINIVKTAYGPKSSSVSSVGSPNEYSTSSALLASAKTFFGSNYSQIWDTSKIGTDYTPDNSPVRNYLLAYINFRNLEGSGSSEKAVGLEDGVGYKADDALPDKNSDVTAFTNYLNAKELAHHEFLGWTDDKTGNSKPFFELPSGLFGDVTLYAVWGLPTDYVSSSITTSLSADTNEITYDSVKNITLTADVQYSVTAMTDPVTTYTFLQDGNKKSSTTSGKLTVKNVVDSGKYTFTYKLADSIEPLWRYEGTSDKEQSITINKGILSLDTFKITNKPYYKMPVKDITFTATAKNSSGISVALSSSNWTSTIVSNTVKDGDNTQTIRLVPMDTSNYKAYEDFDVDFQSETLYAYFIFPEISEYLQAELEYDQSYSAQQLIFEFNKVYLDALVNNTAFINAGVPGSGLAPYFSDEAVDSSVKNPGAPIVTDSSGKALYDTVHDHVKEEFNVYVYLNEVYYTVTFDANSASNTTQLPDPEEYGYGKFIIKPNDPTNGDLLFVGWYFTDSDGVNRAWRFFSETLTDGTVIPQDRVTGNTKLVAEWLQASQLNTVTFVVNPSSKFTALEKIASGDLTVTGHYLGIKDGITATGDKTIAYGDYVIEYGYLDANNDFVKQYNDLRVIDGGMYIRVGVDYNGKTIYSDPQNITVNPIDISDLTEQFNFGDTNGTIQFDYDGNPHYVPTISNSNITALTDGKITGIVYEYRNRDTGDKVTDPTEIGEYEVTITYTPSSANYSAKPTTLIMKISTTIKVKVEWDTKSLMYSGAEQHPVVSKIYNAETGDEISVNSSLINYSGDIDAKTINILNHYKVSVSLGDRYTVVDGEECSFDIVKALLEIPTYLAGTILYDGTTKVLEDCLGSSFNPLLMEIKDGGTGIAVNTYRATIALKDTQNCSWADGSITSKQIEWKIEPALLYVSWDEWEFVDDGVSSYAPQISNLLGLVGSDSFDFKNDFIYKIYDEEGNLLDGVSEVDEIGSYKIVASFNGTVKNYTLDSTTKEWSFVVVPKSGMTILTIEWDNTSFIYDGDIHYPKPTIKDSNGNDVTSDIMAYLKFSDGYNTHRDMGTYTVKVTLKDSAAEEYFIRSGATCKFKITDENGYAPDEDETNDRLSSGNNGGSGSLDDVLELLKEYWKAIVTGVCIILIIIFLSKAAGYNSRAKRAKKTADDRYKSFYAAGGAIGLFGWASSTWTVIMCVFIALTVASFVIMLLAKKKCVKAEDELAYAKEDFERNKFDEENRRREDEARQRDENMRMMFMNMFGGAAQQGAPTGANMNGDMQGMPQGGYGMQQGIGVADIRGIVSETMTAMLPGVQQLLPAQASANDELVHKLIEQNEKLMEKSQKSEESMLKIMEKSQKNEEAMQNLLMKLSEQPAERVVEREVAASSVNDEAIMQMMRNQEQLMEKILELSANQSAQPQIVEKEVVKEVPVEKIVEVPVEVEKIVEKEVVKEVKVEVPVEVIKEVPVKAEPKPKKEVAPRLTLDEAYALLTKEQKKFFDGLKQYVLDKYKCKEKKATYFVTYGQTATNPLLKLTIKKDTTVALLKMEDELMKDIRRDATGDGTKVKVKETEVLVTDAQAFETAKKMIDLRYDQIERYQDLLKEQRALRR